MLQIITLTLGALPNKAKMGVGCEKEDIKKEDILNIDKDCQGESVYTNKCGLKRERAREMRITERMIA